MKCHDNADDDYLDDPIQLNFGAAAPRLENVQFLDPGIIDLDCDSDEDYKYIDEDTVDINLLGGTTPLQTVTTISNRIAVKPMCIQLVDCYKFPWYFDQPTKNIIEKKLLINNSVDITFNEQVVDFSSKEVNKSSDKCIYEIIDDDSDCKSAVNEISKQNIIDIYSNKSKYVNDKCMNKTIDMKRVHEMFSVQDYKNRLVNCKKINDMEIKKALSQKNKTEVNLKKNKGLVGMKVQRIKSTKQTMEIKDKTKEQIEKRQKSNEQETLDSLYVQTADSTLTTIGTTVTPVFKETGKTKESDFSKSTPNDDKVDVCQKEFKSKTANVTGILKMPASSESGKSSEDLRYISAQRDNNQKDMSTRIHETKKIAEEIVRIVTSQCKEKSHIEEKPCHARNKLYKAMPFSKQCLFLMDENLKSLEQKKETEACKTTKLISPIALSKGRKQEKNEIVKLAKDTFMFESQDKQSQNIASPLQTDTYTPNKSFKTLNKFTENILNKIQAKQQQQQQSNLNTSIPEKLHKKRISVHDKNKCHFGQTKPIGECESMLSECTIKANTLKDLVLGKEPTKKVFDAVKYSTSRQITPQKTETETNNPDLSPNKHLQCPFATDTLPLKTIVMKTAKSDYAKINEGQDTIVASTTISDSNAANHVNQSNTITEQIINVTNINTKGIQRQSSKVVITDDVRYIEHPIKNKDQQLPTMEQTVNDKFNIQTIITSRNKLDTKKQNSIHGVSNLTVHAHVPKAQVSVTLIEPTKAQNGQAQAKDKLTVHNSMQSHILYKPQVDNLPPYQMFSNNLGALRYQTSVQQTNRSFYQQPIWYPTWYGKGEKTTDVPDTPLSSGGIGGITPHIAMNVRPPRANGITTQMSTNPCTMTSQVNGPISPLTEITTRLVDNNRGVLPHMAMYNRPQVPPGVNRSPQKKINARELEVNGGILPPTAMSDKPTRMPQSVNRRIPPQMAMHERHKGDCDVQPSMVSWSYAFPPPIPPPPPPPFPPPYQANNESKTIDNSVIGRNNDGVIRKINITSPLVDCDTETSIKKRKIKNKYVESDSTPLLDEAPTDVLESSTLATTKLEMLHVLDTSMKEIHSPLKHSEGIFSTFTSQSPVNHLPRTSTANRVDSRISQQSDKKQAVNMSKQKMQLKKISATHWEVKQPSKLNAPTVKEFDMSMSMSNTSCATQPKDIKAKSNQSPVTNRRTPPCTKLLEDNSIFIDKTNKITNTETNLKHFTQSNKGEARHLEDIKKLDYSSKSGYAFLKRTMPLNEEKCATPIAKYKPGPLSKKMKLQDPRDSAFQLKTNEKRLPNKGYSPPILPIPTFVKILSNIPAPRKNIESDRSVEKSAKKKGSSMNPDKQNLKRHQFKHNSNKIDNSKKISLDEYKKRCTNERIDEESKLYHSKQKESFNKNTVEMPRRASHADSDHGYDSDSTVKL